EKEIYTQPIENVAPKSRYNPNFIFALIAFIFAFIDGLFGLQLEYYGTLKFSGLAHDKNIFLHQVCPREVWFQSDMILLFNSWTVVLVFGVMIFKSNWPQEIVLKPMGDGLHL